MTIHIGLIGAGGIARPHVEGYRKLAGRAEITAIADVVEDNARERAEQTGGDVRTVADYRDLLGAVDAVDICLPHHLHADAIVAAAEAGRHILCEKPLCLTVEEGERVRAAVAASGVTLMCAHNQLFLPPVARARQLLDDGAIGPVYELRTTDSFFNSFDPANMGWRASRATSGGGELIDTGYHPSYLLLHLAGSEPTEVAAMLSTHRLTFADGEDSAQVLVRFAGGVVGTIVTSWAYEPAGCTERFSVVGERGSLWSDGRSLVHRERGGETRTEEFGEVDTFAAEIEHFVTCLEDGTRPLNTHEEGLAVLRMILGAYESAAQRRIVTVAEL